jgi:hypothetical protein
VRQLHDEVRQAADPQGHGRQYLAAQLEKLAGTRMAGYMFTRQAPAGKWGAATYALKKTGTAAEHRDHRGHRPDGPDAPYAEGGSIGNGQAPATSKTPMTPMTPMSSATGAKSAPSWRKRL